MKIKKEYIILVVIIIGLSVYLYMRRSDRTLYELPEMPKVVKKEITRLQITKGETEIVLSKKDEQWYLEPAGYPADANKIKDMLNALENLTLTALVSESKNYNRYDLAQDQKINLKAWQGENLKLNIDVGKTASSFRHTFVRPSGDERVFHAQGNLKNNFDVTVDGLRDKTVLALKPEDIQQINITKQQRSFAFTRTTVPVEVKTSSSEKKEENASQPAPNPVWQADSGQPVNESAISQLLNAVAKLRCEKFIDDRKKEDFTSPLFTLQLKGAQDHELFIFAKTEENDPNYPAVSSDSDYAFMLSDSQVNRIMKDPSALLQAQKTDQKKSEPEETDAQ